jgi:hypothetical protein
MPTPNRFTDAANEASNLTNSELADQIASTTKLDMETINDIIPLKRDKDAFAKLMEQVEADTTMDEKLAFLQDNIQTVGAVALNLLKVLV